MIIIGNTPEQLGSVTTANALIIDGKVFTKEQVIALQAERDALAAQVGAFAAMIIEVRSTDESKDFLGSDWHERSDALIASTPEHHLAAHDAEVAKAAFIEGARQAAHNEIGWFGYGVNECAELYSSGLNK